MSDGREFEIKHLMVTLNVSRHHAERLLRRIASFQADLAAAGAPTSFFTIVSVLRSPQPDFASVCGRMVGRRKARGLLRE